ncbi:hypothetical protein QOZ80_5BG0428960 [Eleusine coracana subsp. coracana]|nr:hypothetical protein QOZ80_5BG0428960 [Eleusine coracana subsp. coracana]
MPPKDDATNKAEVEDLTKLMQAVNAKLECLTTMESKLEAIDNQQRVQNAAIQRLQQQFRQPSPNNDGRGYSSSYDDGRRRDYFRDAYDDGQHQEPYRDRYEDEWRRQPDRPVRHQKWDFPKYDGKGDPIFFLNKCDSFFRAQRILEEEKVWMATHNLNDSAHIWYMHIEKQEGDFLTWRHFSELLNMRFGPPLRSNPLSELAACRQTGTIEEYQEHFLELLARARPLTNSQQIQLFTVSLLEPLSINVVELQNPQTLEFAMSMARSIESSSSTPCFTGDSKGLLTLPSSSGTASTPTPAPAATSTPATTMTVAGRPIRRLTAKEMEERRRKDQCFNCDEKYVCGHNKVCKRLFLLELMDYDTEFPDQDDEPHISISAITGVSIGETMQMATHMGSSVLNALLDSGSTHNFVSEAAAEATGLDYTPCSGLYVMVANGERVPCPSIVRGVAFSINNAPFRADFYILPLGGYDVVLGTRWLATLGPILWDFSRLYMSFWHLDRRIEWQGAPGPVKPRILSCEGRDLLHGLLEEFTDVFEEPRDLPPQRFRDHRIHLKPGTPPIVVRPYRYPANQKDELERQCRLMLEQGLIRRSSSAFSSPVLLLLDKLHGATFFTKLGLRSGYHQVRMHTDDIEKTTFRTHEDLYEFLVMPFGLSNAPATFQALMNEVLRPFLRKFVLVFFDDILIYSPSWSTHICHLRAVLEVLRRHELFVKRSKCSFVEETVAYLGHVVSAGGGAMTAPRSRLWSTGCLRVLFGHCAGSWALPATIEAMAAFDRLKQALTTAPVLCLPNFNMTFTVECDASGSGCEAVLHQGAGPIAFFSRPVAPRHQGLAAYERELIGLVQAIRHWQPYLWGRRFLDKTDHYSLKFLLDQRLATVPQHHWVSKILGFNFTVEYKPGKQNIVADALSRRDEELVGTHAISAPTFPLLEEVRAAAETDPALIALRDQIVAEGLPKVAGKSVILTVVDCFSKYAHFIALAHPYTAESVARAFFDEIVRLHGIPTSITSDRDPVFTSAFWKELFSASGYKMTMSSAFQPQTDGQSKAMNKTIAMYLRCLTGDRPRNWVRWLPWAEYTYNTSFHTALRDTPFKVVYGRDPPSLRFYEAGDLRVAAVAKTLADRDEFLQDVKARLEQAQHRAKCYYDRGHREVQFEVGDWVWLRLRHIFPTGVPDASQGKLRPRFFGPFQIVSRINEVAYKLKLPPGTRMHDVFHVGLLKKFMGEPPTESPVLPPIHYGAAVLTPGKAVKARMCRGVRQILVQWVGQPASEASWEDVDSFQDRYPAFQLEDELLLEGGERCYVGPAVLQKE